MAGHLEREFKLRIPSEAAWQGLLARLGGPSASPVVQVNHFFDTDSRALAGAHIALRLRDEDGRFTLGLKGPRLGDDPRLATRAEEELEIEAQLADALLAGRGSPFEVFAASPLAGRALVEEARALAAGAPLRHLGSFVNERTRVGPLTFPPGSGGPELVFELDRTRFPDGSEERELELELPHDSRADEIEPALLSLAAGLAMPSEAMPSKAARFFRCLEGLARLKG